MSQFYGTHQNRLDAKGRVSVPAMFRAALRDPADPDAPITVILRPSHKHACIEGWPPALFAALVQSFEKLPKFSDAYEDFATSIFSEAIPVEADKEGRILVPADLIEHAHLSGQAAFMGIGETFQIWEPEAGKRRRQQSRENSRQREIPV